MKLTKEQIIEMNELKSKGKTFLEIAKVFNVSISCVQYHTDLKFKELAKNNSKEVYRNLPIEKRKELAKKHLGYQRVYQSKRYHSDELFRKKMIEANKICNKKRREKK